MDSTGNCRDLNELANSKTLHSTVILERTCPGHMLVFSFALRTLFGYWFVLMENKCVWFSSVHQNTSSRGKTCLDHLKMENLH